MKMIYLVLLLMSFALPAVSLISRANIQCLIRQSSGYENQEGVVNDFKKCRPPDYSCYNNDGS